MRRIDWPLVVVTVILLGVVIVGILLCGQP